MAAARSPASRRATRRAAVAGTDARPRSERSRLLVPAPVTSAVCACWSEAIVRPMSNETIHPVLKAHGERRMSRLQDRIADSITRFAGSMSFVFVHVAWFGAWIILGIESFPYGLLTM